MNRDEAIDLICRRGFVAMARPDFGPEGILAAKRTRDPSGSVDVLELARWIVADGSGWAVLEGVGQMPRTFIPAEFVRTSYATLEEAVSAVLAILETT
jgi:hypothetical protein